MVIIKNHLTQFDRTSFSPLPLAGENARPWKDAYGTFCSQHSEAVNLFKDISKSDRRFQQFIRQCANNPLLKKKGVAECILFVTTRITKYPLLIEPLVKTAKDLPTEQAKLKDASVFVRVSFFNCVCKGI